MRTSFTTLQVGGLMLLGCGLLAGAATPSPVFSLVIASRLLLTVGFIATSLGILQEVRGRPPQHF